MAQDFLSILNLNYMKNILTIGDLRQAIQHLDDHDVVVVEIHEGERQEDLYTFYIDDSITIVSDDLNSTMREVRICI
jgi:hypothetical protein